MFPHFTVYAQNLQEWGNCVVDGVPTLKCAEVVINNLLTISTALIILALFIMFIVGGFQYLTSLGNAEKVKKAQGTLRYALIGFLLFLGSYLILKIIGIVFLGDANKLFNFTLPGP